jgi:crossover junction endodeoxyribonuclease RusA
MRVSTFTVEAPADWINSNQRLHRMAVAKLTRLWREAGHDAVARNGWEPYAGRVHIVAHIWKPRGGRYDPNNLWPTVKAAIDGVVESGLLADDDHLHVEGPDMRHGGKGAAALVLTIREIG